MLMRRWHSLWGRVSGQSLRGGGPHGDVLGQEELELLVGELAQLGTEHIVDADVVCIPSAGVAGLAWVIRGAQQSLRMKGAPAAVQVAVASGHRGERAQLTQGRRRPARGRC